MLPLWTAIQSFFTGMPGGRKGRGGKHGAGAHIGPEVSVVAIVAGDRDRNLLKEIGARTQLNMRFADTCGEAWTAANRLEAPVILCQRDAPGLEWRDAVRILASATPRPCVILASPVVDNYLWQEVIAQGGYDVLVTPLRTEDVLRSLKLAISWWKSSLGKRQSAPNR